MRQSWASCPWTIIWSKTSRGETEVWSSSLSSPSPAPGPSFSRASYRKQQQKQYNTSRKRNISCSLSSKGLIFYIFYISPFSTLPSFLLSSLSSCLLVYLSLPPDVERGGSGQSQLKQAFIWRGGLLFLWPVGGGGGWGVRGGEVEGDGGGRRQHRRTWRWIITAGGGGENDRVGGVRLVGVDQSDLCRQTPKFRFRYLFACVLVLSQYYSKVSEHSFGSGGHVHLSLMLRSIPW